MAAEPDTLPSNLTIGAVCRMLGEEFDDISISKIRFLEDQKLIAPRRTQGGYRLFSLDDVERLRAILRMQRDEFLPLAVIRDMLTQGVSRPTGTRRRRARALAQADRQLTLEDLVGETDADLRFIQELARYGVAARHLKAFRSAVGREAGLLEQILAPSLRSSNADRREAGLEELEALAELTSDLTHLLLVRDLRDVAR